MTLEAGTSIGKYVVKSMLAEGGMAEIYLAASTGPEGFAKEVVIKRVRSFLSKDEGFVQMFIAEARLASGLNHANVVQIFDFDKHEDSYYLAMEYVYGCSLWDLRKRCREKGVRVPPVLVAHIGAQVAAGLHCAHRLKSPDGELLHLVHRDVTPHNVLLSFDGAVKLTDFGIAKASNKLTQPGVLKGKFAYMSPEQARGEPVDARTDVFALGVVLWEMLTGGRLFDGESDIAVLRAVQESAIARPARLNPDVPEDLDEVVCTALERDPEARYQSAGELERALAQCVLRRATSVDDTDVGTFVRQIFGKPLTQFFPRPAALMDRSSRSRTGESPSVAVGESSTQEPAPTREPTAVLSGTGPASGRGRLVRTDSTEESLVSASTLVLSRDGARPSTLGARNSRPMPVVGSAEQGSELQPSTPEPPPMRVAQVMPPVAETTRGRKGLWVGVSVAALALIGGVAALVIPSKQPAPSAPASVPSAPVQGSATAQPVPSPAPTVTPPAGEAPAATPPDEPPPAQKAAAAQSPTGQPAATGSTAPQAAPAAEAKGILTVKVVPYADVYIDGKLVKSELQRPMNIPLAPGTYRLTFKHPARTDSYDVTLTPGGKVTKSFVVPRK